MSAVTRARHASGREIYGILGIDFLQHHVIRIDFDHGKLQFLKSVDLSDERFGKPIRIGYKHIRTPFVAAAASVDHFDHFIVATGATPTGTLSPAFFEEMAQKGRLKRLKESKVQIVSGISSRPAGRIQLLAVKTSVLRNPVVKKGDANLLGLGFWSRHVVTFDFPNRVIYLSQGDRFNEPDRYDLSGLHLLRIDGATIVYSIDDESPAANAGVQPKDRILKMDGKDIGKLSLFTIRKKLSVEAEKVEMTIQRGERQLDVAFPLK